MTQHTLFVCVLCRFSATERSQAGISGGQFLFNRLQDELKNGEKTDRIHLQPVRCLGACDRSCVVALTAPNKLTFVLSQLSPTDAVPDLLQFSQQYVACAGGKVPYGERPEAVKKGIHAVLPPSPQ
jgi:predicted metal-binding protein